MAVRPAAARGGGLTGLHYGLIAFVVVSVASLGGLIFLLTGVKEVTQRAANAERRLERYGTPPAPVGSYYENEASARNASVFAVMGDDLGRMAQLIAGTKDAVGMALSQQASALLGQIAAGKPGVVSIDDPLLTAIRKLDERLTEEMNANRANQAALAEKEAAIESLTRQLKSVRDQFEQQMGQLKTALGQAQDEFSKRLAEKETQLAELQSTLESREQQLQQFKREGDQEKRELKLQLDRKDSQIVTLQQQVQEQKRGFDAEAILKKADGRILRAIPGSDVVYINLGGRDGIRVGMGFEVYPQLSAPGAPLRGKASLEVATLMDDTAECRVVRTTPGQPIVEGDIVVNIAYEQNRKPKFVARGDFDLNYDGQIDVDGAERVAALIRQWGGAVVPELDETVDFVVIGVAPRVGEVAPGASEVVRDQAERKKLELSQFRQLIDQARAMYIPVITQNQFLFLTGYAGETSLRGR